MWSAVNLSLTPQSLHLSYHIKQGSAFLKKKVNTPFYVNQNVSLIYNLRISLHSFWTYENRVDLHYSDV